MYKQEVKIEDDVDLVFDTGMLFVEVLLIGEWSKFDKQVLVVVFEFVDHQ